MASPSVDPVLLQAVNEDRSTLGLEPLTAAFGFDFSRLSKQFLSEKAKHQPRNPFNKQWVDSGIRLDEPDLEGFDRDGDIRLDAPRSSGADALRGTPPSSRREAGRAREAGGSAGPGIDLGGGSTAGRDVGSLQGPRDSEVPRGGGTGGGLTSQEWQESPDTITKGKRWDLHPDGDHIAIQEPYYEGMGYAGHAFLYRADPKNPPSRRFSAETLEEAQQQGLAALEDLRAEHPAAKPSDEPPPDEPDSDLDLFELVNRGLSPSGREIIDHAESKESPRFVGEQWDVQRMDRGASGPFVWTDQETGEKFLVKDRGGRHGGFKFEEDALRNEEAASKLLRTLGVRSAPVVEQNGEISVAEWAGKDDDLESMETLRDHVRGERQTQRYEDNIVEQLDDPDDVLRIAMADVLMGNRDRHEENALIGRGRDGRLHIYPIDHNHTDFDLFDRGIYDRSMYQGANDLLLAHYLDYLRSRGIEDEDEMVEFLTDKLTQMQEEALENMDPQAWGPLGRMYDNLQWLDIDLMVEQIMEAPDHYIDYWEDYEDEEIR